MDYIICSKITICVHLKKYNFNSLDNMQRNRERVHLKYISINIEILKEEEKSDARSIEKQARKQEQKSKYFKSLELTHFVFYKCKIEFYVE